MKKSSSKAINLVWLLSFLFLVVSSCQKNMEKMAAPTGDATITSKDPQTLKDFIQVNLVGDNNQYQPAVIDPDFINGWGIAFAPAAAGPAWVSSEVSGLSKIYNKTGATLRPRVIIPSHSAHFGGHPSGQVFNGSSDFKLSSNNLPARFIFAGTDGVISGWNAGDTAIKMVDDTPDASYFGITIATNGGANFLYAANFAEKKIDVYNSTWAEVSMPFIDPDLPSDYSPFNIQNVGGKLYVMYSKLGADGNEVVSPGNGYVDIYNPDGSLFKRFVSRGQLNAPWGVAMAPVGFWGDDPANITNVILVGNFGDGHINAFDENGNFLGQLRAHGNPIVIQGLWAITFAPAAATSVDPNWLFFAAGPGDEEHGLFGYLRK